MKKDFKKVTKAVSSFAVALSLLVGCAASNTPTSDSKTSTSADTNTASETKTEAVAKKVEMPKGEKLTWYFRGKVSDWPEAEMESIKELQKRTGIEIEFIMVSENQDDQYKMMIASGNYPDFIHWTHQATYPGGIAKLAEDGVARELNQLIDEYMPNFKSIIESKPSVKREISSDNGKFNYFPNLNPMETEQDKLRLSTTGFVMRKDWLENVGLETPTNMDEWYEALTAFKNYDPNNNGLQDEVPFEGTGLNMFGPAFGIRNTYYSDLKTQKVKYGPIEPEYKEYLATLNKWYTEGLIGKNSITTDNKLTDNNITSDIAGSFKGLDNAWDKYLKTLQEKNPDADFVAVPWPATKDGIVYTDRTEHKSHINKESVILTTSCKYPEAAATLIDYMYSDEGSFLLSWGIEGKSFDYVDGKPQFKEFDGVTDSLSAYVRATWSLPKYGYVDAQIANYAPIRAQASSVWVKVNSDLIIPPSISFTAEENNKIIDYNEEMGVYVNDMFAKFVTGEEPLSNFDSYVQTLKKMNVEEIIQIQQNALDRYNAR